MHELAIAQSVIEIAQRHAAGRPVTRVHLRVGHLRQIVPSALIFNFELVAEGTEVHGARLEIESVPARGLCRRCDAESTLQAFPLSCRACGGYDLQIVSGDELIVESLDVDEAAASVSGS